MPNHVINEVVFRDLSPDRRAELLAHTVNGEGEIDFSILLPIPLNCWMGNVNVLHEQAFKHTALDWCRENWGTKWGAYDQRPIEDHPDSLVLVFETAWRPPYGWLCALFNRFRLPFDHNWWDEGALVGRVGRFEPKYLDNYTSNPWVERDATPDEHNRLRAMHYPDLIACGVRGQQEGR